MGRPLNFGYKIHKEQAHSNPEVADKLQQLDVGDIVRIDIEEIQEIVFDSDLIGGMVRAHPILQRQASTYGLTQIMFNKNENYIVANRYNRNVGGKELNMIILFPLLHADNKNNENNDGILTWLIDSAGWIRIAEDFGIIHNITNVTVINKIPINCPIYIKLNEIEINKDGVNKDSGSTIFYSNNECIQYKSIHIPFA
jgi:hypothetical protein